MESFANWSGNTHCCQWVTDQSVGLCDWALAIIFQATIINIQQPVEILIFPPYKCHRSVSCVARALFTSPYIDTMIATHPKWCKS